MKVRVPLIDQLANMRADYKSAHVRALVANATIDELAEKRPLDGMNAYHLLAVNNVLIPADKLNTEVLMSEDNFRNTPLHYLGTTSAINCLPGRLMTADVLFVKNNDGETPFTSILKADNIKRIPSKFITKENLLAANNDGETNLYQMAKLGYIAGLPAVFHTQEMMETRNPKGLNANDYEAATVFHALGTSGTLDCLPPALVTDANMSLVDHFGQTPLHYAALNRKLSQVDARLLTQDSITKADKSATTVLHIASQMEDLGYIPLSLLTPANLSLERSNLAGSLESVAKILSENGSWKGLPPYNWQPHEFSKHATALGAWRDLFKKTKLPLPPSLSQQWATIEKDGEWQHL